ncbi:MAG TPA: RNA polymerase sigma factor [Sedimentisphaerales bacterium]|nr:RNA polymerase sigma factor [Sedimentisphaerales bacterium]
MQPAREQIIDQLLVMDAQDGDARAMEKLVGRWQKRLWQHAYRLIGDSEAAWDVTQQTWLGIIKGLRKLRDPADFRAWAYRTTTNKAIDWRKRSRAARQVSIEDIQDPPQEQKKDAGLKDLLEKLDIRKRAVLSLYYFEQLSVPEIGAALNIPTGTVKSRLHNARKELKELWQQHSK